MTPKRLFIAVLCLFVFAVIGHARQTDSASGDFLSLDDQLFANALSKVMVRQFWDGRGADLAIAERLDEPDIRVAFGISDEQYQQFEDNYNAIGESPEICKREEEIEDEIKTIPDNWEDDEKAIKKVQEISEKMDLVVSGKLNAAADSFDNMLTPEQKQKIQESQLANMAEMPIISTSMFEALNLTDDQKQQMKKIKKELEPEFEQTFKNWISGELTMENKILNALKKEENAKMNMDRDAMRKKLIAEDPEFKRIHEKNLSGGKAFATKFKIKMFDVLTDEQWKKLQKLIDDPPEHAKILGKKLREMTGANEKDEAWQPGPNSWKPGDAIPEEYRKKRETKKPFPQAESTEPPS